MNPFAVWLEWCSSLMLISRPPAPYISRIEPKRDNDQPTVMRPCTSHGWMRRHELSTHYTTVWETPDGSLHTTQKNIIPMLRSKVRAE